MGSTYNAGLSKFGTLKDEFEYLSTQLEYFPEFMVNQWWKLYTHYYETYMAVYFIFTIHAYVAMYILGIGNWDISNEANKLDLERRYKVSMYDNFNPAEMGVYHYLLSGGSDSPGLMSFGT